MKPALVLGGLAALGAAAAMGQAPAPAPIGSPTAPASSPYGDVTWSELAFSAHKFFLGAATRIRVECVPTSVVVEALRPATGLQPVPIPPGGAAAITVDTDLPFGRDESVRLFFDPFTGAALGGEKTMLGSSAYHKLLRYTDGGLFTWRSAPANDREAALPPAAWTQRKSNLVQPAAAPRTGAPVADSYALIYMISAAHLDRQGSSVSLFMLADDRFVEVVFVAGGLTYRTVSFEEAWPGGRRRREGKILVRQVMATARALGARETSEDVDLGFMGMRGSLTVYLEAGTDLPVALSGRVEHIGELTVRLNRVVLILEPRPAPTP